MPLYTKIHYQLNVQNTTDLMDINNKIKQKWKFNKNLTNKMNKVTKIFQI